ncbi:MAG TPA: hypothetical protein VMW01_16555 [Williamwhitmania sp.]|nr:hypothetical protein [Williamwhitmania sp.]
MKNFLLLIYHFFGLLLAYVVVAIRAAYPVVKRFIANWNEILTIPLALVLWYFSPMLLRMMDPVAATFDTGILQVYLLAAIGLFFFNGVAWLLIKLSFPGIYKWVDKEFEGHVAGNKSIPGTVTEQTRMLNLTTYQKCAISLFLFALYFIALVVLVRIP